MEEQRNRENTMYDTACVRRLYKLRTLRLAQGAKRVTDIHDMLDNRAYDQNDAYQENKIYKEAECIHELEKQYIGFLPLRAPISNQY
eukprot:5359588-Amphidinium_carterae.1